MEGKHGFYRSKSPFPPQDVDYKFLYLLSKKFPNKRSAKVEIVNLKAILELPRGTEHFISDIHGEFEAFIHILKNSSGLIRDIINQSQTLSLLGEKEAKELATLIYYPKQRIGLVMQELKTEAEKNEWFKLQIRRILIVLKGVTFKYTRSKVQKNLPEDYGYIIQELLTERIQGTTHLHRMVESYYESIVENIVREGSGRRMIIEMSRVIQKMGVEDLHIVGDIFDRGPGAEIVMDYLINSKAKVDVQFGNHDVLWMGAAVGNLACIANIVRISVRYSSTKTLEEGYGVGLNPLREFTKKWYGTKKLSKFFKGANSASMDGVSMAQLEKAIFIIQMKLEAKIIRDHPEYEMKSRLFLSKIDWEKYEVEIDGKIYKMNDTNWPTIDPKDPEKLNDDEIALMMRLRELVMRSEKFHKHISFLFQKGSMYLVRNSNLLFHASVPITSNFEFMEVDVEGKKLKGRELMDEIDMNLRKQYYKRNKPDVNDTIPWWLWCGENSPLFGKSKMATFERYFIEDKSTWKEHKGFYYTARNDPRLVAMLFKEFGVDPKKGHVIVGHVPVMEKAGEDPVMCNGKYITIDGGLSKAYQSLTGIAGYTLRIDSSGIYLCVHRPFTTTEDTIRNLCDLDSETRIIDRFEERVKDTDIGISLREQIQDCRKLIRAYEEKVLKQQIVKTRVIHY